jgi:hypothetical protein
MVYRECYIPCSIKPIVSNVYGKSRGLLVNAIYLRPCHSCSGATWKGNNTGDPRGRPGQRSQEDENADAHQLPCHATPPFTEELTAAGVTLRGKGCGPGSALILAYFLRRRLTHARPRSPVPRSHTAPGMGVGTGEPL